MTPAAMPTRAALALVLALNLAPERVSAATSGAGPCEGPLVSNTQPAPVDIAVMTTAVRALRTTAQAPALDLTPALDWDLASVFNLYLVKTKMEQFFRLLYALQAHVKPDLGRVVDLDPVLVRAVLLSSAVFTDPRVPHALTSVRIDRSDADDPRYFVTFDQDPLRIPLNGGKNFYAYERGRCQRSEALLFHGSFAFSLRLLRNGNLAARSFNGVDFLGDFGARGMVDVDFNYIALDSVEFFKGTKEGEITARVSRQEFEKNKHNALLRILSRFVKNSTVAPIDW